MLTKCEAFQSLFKQPDDLAMSINLHKQISHAFQYLILAMQASWTLTRVTAWKSLQVDP